MATEKLTDQQKQVSDMLEESCQASLVQQNKQKAQESLQKAKEQLDKQSQMLAQLPEQAVIKLDKAEKQLMSIIDGYVDIDSPEFNIDKIIKQIEQMIKPLINMLGSIPVPSIPGIQQISDLLTALKTLIKITDDKKDKENKEDDQNENLEDQLKQGLEDGMDKISEIEVKVPPVEIPPKLIETAKRLIISIISLCVMLPLVLINLIFQMIAAIIKMFKKISEKLGYPEIPYPLNLVANCLEMMPEIIKFVKNAPTKLYDTVCGSLKKAYGKITSLQVPSIPDDVNVPKSLQTCSLHAKKAEDNDKTNDEDNTNFTEEDKENARELLKEWYSS